MHTHDDKSRSSMRQMIFKIGLPVETVSVYLLCCGLNDTGKAITTKNLFQIWNGTEEALKAGLKSLEENNIIVRIISDQQKKNVYKLTDECDWKVNEGIL